MRRLAAVLALAFSLLTLTGAVALAEGSTDPGVAAGQWASRNLQALYLYLIVPAGLIGGYTSGRLPGVVGAAICLALLYPFLFHSQATLQWLWGVVSKVVGAS